MKRLFITVVLMITALSCVFSQTASRKASGSSKTEQELMQLEREIGEANVRRDKAFFERIEADEFIFTDSAGGVTNKAQDIASLDSIGESQLISFFPDDMAVRLYGKTAVVTGRVTIKRRNRDKETVNQSRFTDVFVKRAGRWQLVAGHSSRLPPQKSQ